MINAYKQGKDLYATIASKIYHNDYWDNMEHTEAGQANPDGKKRRSSVKGLLLGILYGMGPASLAETIKGTIQDAQKIIDDFYKEFPKVKRWMDETNTNARTFGYVEDFWGRRRRLPDIQLQKYIVELKDAPVNSLDFNPILGTLGIVKREISPKVKRYTEMAENCRGAKEITQLKETALKDGVVITDNSGFISRAERQCVNARVQGGAATMSKRAMIKVHHDEELKSLGFRLMLAVHDELIGECPEENAQKVADRLCDIMKVAALPECQVPFKCDATVERVWYETDYSDVLQQKYASLLKEMSEEEAFLKMSVDHCECTESRLKKFLNIS